MLLDGIWSCTLYAAVFTYGHDVKEPPRPPSLDFAPQSLRFSLVTNITWRTPLGAMAWVLCVLTVNDPLAEVLAEQTMI